MLPFRFQVHRVHRKPSFSPEINSSLLERRQADVFSMYVKHKTQTYKHMYIYVVTIYVHKIYTKNFVNSPNATHMPQLASQPQKCIFGL